MGKLRKKHNWKGRQQSDAQQPAEEEKKNVVVELQVKMDQRGDGSHNSRNGPRLGLNLNARGDWSPAVQLRVRLVRLVEFLLVPGPREPGYALVGDLLLVPEVENANDVGDNIEDQDDENHGNIDNNEIQGNRENPDNNDNILNLDNISNHDSLDNNNHINIDNVDDIVDNHRIDNNNEDAEQAGASAGVEVGVKQGEEEGPLPGVSRRRSREEDEDDFEERSSKRCRWWDEFAESSSDSDGNDSDGNDSDGNDCDDFNKKTGNSPIKHAEVPEEEPLPGLSRKRTRKTDRAEDERSSKKSRQCFEFTDNNSDTVTVTTGHDPAKSSGNITVTEDAAAAEETDKKQETQVDEERDPRPGGSRKKSREDDEEEDTPGSKRFKR